MGLEVKQWQCCEEESWQTLYLIQKLADEQKQIAVTAFAHA